MTYRDNITKPSMYNGIDGGSNFYSGTNSAGSTWGSGDAVSIVVVAIDATVPPVMHINVAAMTQQCTTRVFMMYNDWNSSHLSITGVCHPLCLR